MPVQFLKGLETKSKSRQMILYIYRTNFLPWFLPPHVQLRLLPPYPNYSYASWAALRFYCPTLIIPPSCAASLTSSLSSFLPLHVQLRLLPSYPDYSCLMCCFAFLLSHPDYSTIVCSFAYYFTIFISPSSCAALNSTFLPWLLHPHVHFCQLFSYPDYSSCMRSFEYCFSTLIIFSRVSLCLQLFHPYNESLVCSLAYYFLILISPAFSYAALLTTFLPWSLLIHVQVCLMLFYSDLSFLMCCFTYDFLTLFTATSYAVQLRLPLLSWFFLSYVLHFLLLSCTHYSTLMRSFAY